MISIDQIAVFFIVGGTILNSRMRIEGFYLWGVGNILLLYYANITEQQSLVFLYVFLTLMNLYAVWVWKRKKKKYLKDDLQIHSI